MGNKKIYIIAAGVILIIAAAFFLLKPREEFGKPYGIPQPKTLMAEYTGETVNISGTIFFKKDKGPVVIMVSSEKNKAAGAEPGDISEIVYPKPGNFSLKVSKNAGKVYIDAVIPDVSVDPGDQKPVMLAEGSYSGNPVDIGTNDISKVNIFLQGK